MISSKFGKLTKRFNRIKEFCLIVASGMTLLCNILSFKEQMAY